MTGAAPSTGLIAAEHGKLMRRVAVAAVVTASLLVLLKAVAFILTNSMAMMASMADSALDVFASFINLLAVRHALTPADHEHRFGHGKAEPLAGLAQAAFISGSATFLVIESIDRMIDVRTIEHGTIGLVVMGISIAATLVLVIAQQYVVRRTGSIAISADRMHYLSDILVNLGVIAGIVLATEFALPLADPVMGLVIALVLVAGIWQVFRQSYDQLMDRELPDADRERIKAIALSHADVLDMHDLRTRAAGTQSFIQLHIEMDPALSLYQAHAIADEVENEIRAIYPLAEIIIHQDPKGLEAPEELAKS